MNAIDPTKFVVLWAVTAVGAFVTGAVMRRARRLPFFKPAFDAPQFNENWCSGASDRGLLGSLGLARNCLWIVVTADELRIGPHFPFNLFYLPFVLDLDVTVSTQTIVSVEETRSLFKGDYLRVTYEAADPGGVVVRTRHLDLQPKRREALARLLQEKLRLRKTGPAS